MSRNKNVRIKDPTAPATFKQGFALFKICKCDVRALITEGKLSKGMASTFIGRAKDGAAEAVRQELLELGAIDKAKEGESVSTGPDFGAIYEEAWKAGQDAVAALKDENVALMRVQGYNNVFEPCGFAWVQVKPGNSKFANWLKRNGLARSASYEGGVKIWIGDYGQSHQRKYTHARAMAQVLRERLGMERIYAGDRLD